ncbi:MAG: metallophosphoesterase [Phycisphaerae bacterium]|nr:metallophosphoesterase [Phycisphaerae bacterium]
MSNAFAETFTAAARLNRQDARRRGNLLTLDAATTDVVLAGDIHGHRGNLAKIIEYAALGANPGRVLVLQEIIHGPPDANGRDRSVELLARAARLKVAHPTQVIFLLGNHDLSQVTGNEITKEGRGVCKAFTAGVEYSFGPAAAEVGPAMVDFLTSLPLAVRCPNGVLLSHSLPSASRMDKVDLAFARRDYASEEMSRGGMAYEWTWGRQQTAEQLQEIARRLGVNFFVLGHRHSGNGWEKIADNAICVSSDNERGQLLHMDAREAATYDGIVARLRPIVALGASNG